MCRAPNFFFFFPVQDNLHLPCNTSLKVGKRRANANAQIFQTALATLNHPIKLPDSTSLGNSAGGGGLQELLLS